MAGAPGGADDTATQDALFGPAPRRRGRRGRPGSDGGTEPADPVDAEPAEGPVAHVAVDVPHHHLDHPFTYAVPAGLADTLTTGSRVVVAFAGRSHDGWVLATGTGPLDGLRPVRRVVGDLAPLTPEVAGLARAVADDLAGTLPDVLRSAVPPRHATAERAVLDAPADAPGDAAPVAAPVVAPVAVEEATPWAALVGGEAFLHRLRAGEGPRAAVRPTLTTDPARLVADAVAAARAGGRGSVVVAPDVAAVEAVLAGAGLAEDPRCVALHHDLGPAARWRAFVTARTGRADVVVGTRSAVFAPVEPLGLVVVLDEGDDGHVEPHAPGWDSARAGLLRAERAGAALALVSVGRSTRVQQWVAQGRVRSLAPARAARRSGAPRVVVPDPADPLEAAARLPRTVLRAVRDALASGPVLVQVPRGGWASALRCARCRHAARCRRCAGPLAVPDAATAPTCGWCTLAHPDWTCPHCHGTRLRAGAVGVGRSADELGRGFPGVPVHVSRSGERRHGAPAHPSLVVATPGAEPRAQDGYAAAVVLDGDLALARQGLDVEEETLRRWCAVGGLVRPAPDGGLLVVVADPAHRVVQALVQDAPELLADRLLAERREAGLPPARTLARILGQESDLAAAAASLRGEDTLAVLTGGPAVPPVRVLGPAPVGGAWQVLVTGAHADVVAAVRALLSARSATKAPGRLVVRVDPPDLA
ncbi:hypothetical protein [Aquipuribacter nitratireducens]|uniref:Probable replication restart protein PriA n=1 Tax=Aquipuribacter nitratireducens TaxID=650104 RepID=A0ABW0GR17_9MICO